MAHTHRLADKDTTDKIDMKSAVISGAFEGLSKDEIDRFYTQNLYEVQAKPKKGSFQITSVTSGSHVTRDDDPGDDSQDDLDDTHTYTEDNMSMDWSKTTDLDDNNHKPVIMEEEPTPEEASRPPLQPLPRLPEPGPAAVVPPPAAIKERSSTDNQSRFRVVKIVTHEPFKRGRWTCFDFLPDPNKPTPENVTLDFRENKDHVVVTGSETSSAASSIHYVHGQDDPAKNPLAGGQPITQTLTSPIYFDSDQSKQQQQGHMLNGHDTLGYADHHVDSSGQVVKTPDFPPINGNGGPSLPYNPVQPPVHQAAMSSNQPPLVSNALQPHSSGVGRGAHATHSAHSGLDANTSIMPNVLSQQNYPGRQNGPFSTDVPHSTPRAMSRAISMDRPGSRTHRISIGGEELDLSDDFGKAGNLLEQIAGIPGALASPTKETDGEDSGPNSVAIDNKIEQAMDLVKSHLMFAVREEVEVLKEQITELEDTKRKLEFENNFLKSAASSETLAKLAQAQQQHQLLQHQQLLQQQPQQHHQQQHHHQQQLHHQQQQQQQQQLQQQQQHQQQQQQQQQQQHHHQQQQQKQPPPNT